MPELRPVSTSRRAVLFSGLMATLLAITSISPAPTAAADELRGPAPSPTRSGEPKGGGTPPESEPTGRLIVTYRDGVSQADRGKVRAAEALQLVSSVALPNAELVATAVGGVGPALAALERRADVVSVEPEYRRTRLAGPTGEPTADTMATDVGIAGSGASAEEAAVHVIEDDQL